MSPATGSTLPTSGAALAAPAARATSAAPPVRNSRRDTSHMVASLEDAPHYNPLNSVSEAPEKLQSRRGRDPPAARSRAASTADRRGGSDPERQTWSLGAASWRRARPG